jgi:hypothetical protein
VESYRIALAYAKDTTDDSAVHAISKALEDLKAHVDPVLFTKQLAIPITAAPPTKRGSFVPAHHEQHQQQAAHHDPKKRMGVPGSMSVRDGLIPDLPTSGSGKRLNAVAGDSLHPSASGAPRRPSTTLSPLAAQ